MEIKSIIPSDAFIIGTGTRSICYRSKDTVYKEMPISSAEQYKIIVYEYELLKQYLGEYVHETEFVLVEDGNEIASVVAKQNFIEGKQINDFILTMDDKGEDDVRHFFMSCLDMYNNTGLVPDVFGRPHGIGWYNPLTTPNVLISTDQRSKVKLLDVGLSRISRMKVAGVLHNFLLSWGIKNYLSK